MYLLLQSFQYIPYKDTHRAEGAGNVERFQRLYITQYKLLLIFFPHKENLFPKTGRFLQVANLKI
jgi:hypothetical protein